MTWQDDYWNDAVDNIQYFATVEFQNVLVDRYSYELFSSWVYEAHPAPLEQMLAVQYLIAVDTHGQDCEGMLETLVKLSYPERDPVMVAALAQLATGYDGVPEQLDDEGDLWALATLVRERQDCFELWRDSLVQESWRQLTDSAAMDGFVHACRRLATEVMNAELNQELAKHQPGATEEPHSGPVLHQDSPHQEEGAATVARSKRVRFTEPAEIVAKRQPRWQSYSFRIGVTFTLHPEVNSYLPGECSWTEAQLHLSQWGINLDDLVERIDQAADSRLGRHRDDRMDVLVMGELVDVAVTMESSLNAHNTGILATLNTDGAYTHYVQFKDLVMFYVDESDMMTPIYNVLKTFGDLWAGGNAESYVVRHGKGSKAYFTVTPVKASHQNSLVAVVRRCSNGMRVEVLN